MSRIKYIAAGFVQDAEKLLTEFVKEKSPQFSVFAHFWKKHNFAAIYLGRSSSELQQFTHEIFQLTLKFLVASDLYHQIGGVYMLYALYRNQIVEPPTRIRIILKQYQCFLEMRNLALNQKYKNLLYVIDYLLENAFDLVAHPTLVGPRNSKHKMEVEKDELQMACLLKDLKDHSLSLFESSSLAEIQELDQAYTEATKCLPFKSNMFHDETDWKLDTQLDKLCKVLVEKLPDSDAISQSEKEHDNIGNRRAQIKSDAFASKAWFRQLNPTDEDEDEDNKRYTRSRAQKQYLSGNTQLPKETAENEGEEQCDEKEIKLKQRKRTRIPKEKRRIGRPKKAQDLEQLLMEDVDIPKSKKLGGLKKRGPIARSSYLDRYIEQPFKEPDVEISMLSSSTSEEENIDEPEEIVTLHDDDDEEEEDDDDKVLVF